MEDTAALRRQRAAARPRHSASSRPPARRQPRILRAGDVRRRLRWVFAVTLLLVVAVVGKVVWVEVRGADALRAAGKAQRTSESVLLASRGTVFSRDGAELALSVPARTIIANPKNVTDPVGAVSVLATMLSLTPEKQQSLLTAFNDKTKSFVYVARQVEQALAESVMALDIAGIGSIEEDRRTMPTGEVGRSILGRTDIDGKGIAGIEMQYDELLTGTNGERIRERDAKGRSIPGSEALTVQPVPGDDLVLTIDRSLQFQVEQALIQRVEDVEAEGGTVIVMDTATGEIFAIANVERDDVDGQVAVTSANLAAVEAFEPGSVAKVFSIAAVVDSGQATPESSIDVPGSITFDRDTQWEKTITDAEPHGLMPMTLRDIIVHSSNIGTLKMAERVGTQGLNDYMKAFGFGVTTGLDFPGESAGMMKDADELQGTEKATVSFGYGYSATSLQLAAAVNAVANGGVYVAPKLLKAVIGVDGVVAETAPSSTHRVISEASASTMADLMTGVVCEGTGKGARIDGISVAGKTGTAYKVQDGGYGEAGDRQYRASFVGFLPADAPQITVLVTIDQPDPTSRDRFGGTAAAPLFTTVSIAAIRELQIVPVAGDTGCPAG